MSWFVADRLILDASVHTVPIDDMIRHDFTTDCLCRPGSHGIPERQPARHASQP